MTPPPDWDTDSRDSPVVELTIDDPAPGPVSPAELAEIVRRLPPAVRDRLRPTDGPRPTGTQQPE